MLSLVQVPAPANSMHQLLLQRVGDGFFALDAKGQIVAPLSLSMRQLFQRSDLEGASFRGLLQPFVTRKFLMAASQFVDSLGIDTAAAAAAVAGNHPLRDVEVRISAPDGSHAVCHYSFEFTAVDLPDEAARWLIRVTDQTTHLLQARELEDLHAQLRMQSEILQSVLKIGPARFASWVRTTDAAMTAINQILRRPARQQQAFRNKLDQTLVEVDRIRRDGTASHLASLATAARQFEIALLELRERQTLSGNDFLPLAVKLHDLFVQFSLVRSLTKPMESAPRLDADRSLDLRPGDTGYELSAASEFDAHLLEQQLTTAAAGTRTEEPLAHTFAQLTEHFAAAQGKLAVLQSTGLQDIPAYYGSMLRNVVAQLIRNAIQHGIETPAEREDEGKPQRGILRLSFATLEKGGYELSFDDDGRGIDAAAVRQVAIAKNLLSSDTATRLRNRQIIKLVFRSGVSTLPQPAHAAPHGAGLAVVRRYIHDAGGTISIGSEPGNGTRFKVSLPAVGQAAAPLAAEQVA